MKILITGATGFIGSELVPTLAARGHELTCLTRQPALQGSDIRWVGDLASLSDQVYDAIINLAGEPLAVRWTEARKARFRSSRIELTEHLAERCRRIPTGKLISGSAIGYYGALNHRARTEDSPCGDDFGAHLCRDWETAALTANCPVTLLRIGIVLHPAGGTLARLLPPFRLGLGGPVGDGQQFLSWIHRTDLVRLIEFLLESDVEGPVNATAPQPVTSSEFAQTLGSQLRRPARLPTPAFALRLAFGEMADSLLLRGPEVLPDRIRAAGFEFTWPDLGAALDDLL